MSRSHSRRSKDNAATARYHRALEAQRPRRSVWDTLLYAIGVVLMFVPTLVIVALSRLAERIQGHE